MLALIIRVIRTCLVSLGALILLVSATPIISWVASRMAGPWNDPTGDVLIVLGGSMLDDGMVGESSYWRTVYAASAYEQHPFREVIVSGGGGPGLPVAEAMKELLVCRGVPATVIRTETRSLSTRENALAMKEMLRGVTGTKVLMTSDYHMLRARRVFEKLGIDVSPRPLPDAIKRGNSFLTRSGAFLDVSREAAAIVYYRVRGWI